MKLDELNDCLRRIEPSYAAELTELVNTHEKVIVLGNGGSSAIASHITQDYTKKLKKRSFTFSDPSRLTCYINDYGMDRAYAQFLSEFVDISTLVILISSSGNSQNILNCADLCRSLNLKYVIMTGFNENNSLRENHSLSAALDIWVDSKDYGVVECIHQILLHLPA